MAQDLPMLEQACTKGTTAPGPPVHGGRAIGCCGWFSSACGSTVGTHQVTAVPLDRWYGWNAVVSFSQYVRCWVCVPMFGAHWYLPPHGSALGRWHCWNAVSFSQYVRCWVCVCLCLAHTGTRLVAARRPRLQGHVPTASPPTAKARWPRLHGHGSTASPQRPRPNVLVSHGYS